MRRPHAAERSTAALCRAEIGAATRNWASGEAIYSWQPACFADDVLDLRQARVCEGEIYAMAGGTPAHADLAASMTRLLGQRLLGRCRDRNAVALQLSFSTNDLFAGIALDEP